MQADESGERTYPVVQNKSTGQLGVVLGTVRVKLADAGKAQALARAHGLSLGRLYARIGFAFFSVGAGQDPFAAARALRADARVADATVEILENVNVPH